jgi:hypothetical protein
VVRSTVADRQKVAYPTAVCCRLAADRSWADGPAVAVAEAGAAEEVVDGTTAIPSCSMPIDSNTRDAHGSVRPSTTRPRRL